MAVVPLAEIVWKPCWRIIPSRFPPIDLFARIAAPEDWSILQEVETLTNERLLLVEGKAALVRLGDRLTGPGTSLIMAPFSHPNPNGDHFSDGTFGIAYALPTFDAALARSIRSREEFLRRTKESPITLQMRVLNIDMSGTLHDLRGKVANDYRDPIVARELCRNLRAEGSYGLIYEDPVSSVGTTVAALRPTILANCRQERHLAYKWDGSRIAQVYDYDDRTLRDL